MLIVSIDKMLIKNLSFIFITIILFINFSLFNIDRNRMTIGVPIATPASSYINSPEMVGFYGNYLKSRPIVINKETLTKCSQECISKDDSCIDACLCKVCWEESIGGNLLDKCKCVNPDITQSLHF